MMKLVKAGRIVAVVAGVLAADGLAWKACAVGEAEFVGL